MASEPKTNAPAPENSGDRKGESAERPRSRGKRRGRDRRDGDAERKGDADRGDASNRDSSPRGGQGRRRERGDRDRRGGDRRGGDRDRRGGDRASAPLTAGLFASTFQDKEMPCRVAGCSNTWTWYGSQQVRSLGQEPPQRMCDAHLGQLNELGDVEVKCRNPGCSNTWTWKRGAQLAQLSKFGKLKRPSRLCDECFKAEKEAADQEVPCKVDTCSRTWTWTRDAQLRHRLWVGRQRQKAEKAAAKAERAAEEAAKRAEARAAEARAAEARAAEAKAAEAAEATDTQTQGEADAPAEAVQVRTEATEAPEAPEAAEASAAKAEGDASDEPAADEGAAEVDEAGAEAASEAEGEADAGETQAKAEDVDEAAQPKRRKRRRRRRRGKKGADAAVDEAEVAAKPVEIPEGPPSRMCTLCAKKVSQLAPKEVPCKVHGCTRTWVWDRASQLRAWAALGTDDLSVEPTPPRRMCETCREFCRSHPDRKIPCGRPGCENTWTYKTGAQLQAALAGRTQDPLRLCDDCSRGGFISSLELGGEELPEGAERMPCVVSGCEGTWVWFPGQKVGSALDDRGLEVGKMCLSCRQERGFDLDVIPPGIGLENPEGAEATPVAAGDAAASEAAPEQAEADAAGATEQAEPDAADATADAASGASEAETEDSQSS